jgi:hypothetical protein
MAPGPSTARLASATLPKKLAAIAHGVAGDCRLQFACEGSIP